MGELNRQPYEIRSVEDVGRVKTLLTRDADGGPTEAPLYRFRLTGAAENRVGDTTNIRGLEYRDNLPLLFNHDQRGLSLGGWENFSADDDYLVADAWFDPGDELAREIERKVQIGAMRDVSIGFIPLEETPRFPDDEEYQGYFGYFGPVHLERARLLEASIVTVPADETATLVRKYDERRRAMAARYQSAQSERLRSIENAAASVMARRLG